MDQLLEVAAYLLHLWRIVLCALAGVVAACILKSIFPALPAGALFAFVFVAASLGVIWNVGVVSAREAAAGRPGPSISKPVAFLGIALIGGLWGGLMEASLGVPAALAATIAAPWLLGPVFAAIAKQPLRVGSIVFTQLAALLGFATPHAIALLFWLAEA